MVAYSYVACSRSLYYGDVTVVKVTPALKRKIMKRAAELRRQGYSKSEALKRAWRELAY